ncbi:MAG: hypothetical protein RL299_1355, partial [Pseudomonadota bacterium]
MTAKNRLTPHLEKIEAVKDKKKLAKDIAAATKHLKFVPWPGPQTQAYLSK